MGCFNVYCAFCGGPPHDPKGNHEGFESEEQAVLYFGEAFKVCFFFFLSRLFNCVVFVGGVGRVWISFGKGVALVIPFKCNNDGWFSFNAWRIP